MVIYPIRFFKFVTYPLAYVLVRTGGRLSRIASRGAEISMEELADAVDLAHTSSPQEHQMLSGIVNFVNTEVEEIMRPRIDLTALDIKSSYEQVKRTIIESGYSRIPVYDEDLDNIKGALYVKDLLPYIGHGDEFGWQQLLRKIYFVPKHKKIDDLLRDFQENKIHVAIVVDEYGATQGLVSLEDILEEVVGEISDESDEDEKFYERLGENLYLFDGKSHIVDFERVIGCDEDIFSDVQGRAETLAGLMLELRRDLLRKGDTVEAHDVRFTVHAMDGHRVDKIKVEILNGNTQNK
jgi:gliding motility-associated protein GldE